MNHEQLVELAFALPELSHLDFDVIDALPDSKLRELLNMREPAPLVERKVRQKKLRKKPPVCMGVELVERDGRLMRCESWRHFASDGSITSRDIFVPVGSRLMWRGRVVSASIVLHWFRTGEVVARVPRADKKPFRAIVRDGAKTKHIGYFATEGERDAAILNYRLNKTIANPMGDK